jgi:peptidoglycan/LPS O-acetylase OafA/YrhL
VKHAGPPSEGSARRLLGLDLVRAAAIAWVMLYHASLFELVSQQSAIVRFGWMGVDLFFVLSGFLIAEQLLRPLAGGRRPSYGRFFSRRAFRTLPAYLVMVGLYFALPVLRDRPHIQPLWQFLTFTQNFGVHPPPAKAFSHAWSLCVEEQFYLLFPFVLILLMYRPSTRKTVAAIVAVLLAGMALRGYLWLHDVAQQPFDIAARANSSRYMDAIYYPTFTRLDGLLAGVVAAAIKTFRPSLWNLLTHRANLLLGVGVAGIVLSAIFFVDQTAAFWPAVFGFPLLSLSIALVVIAASTPTSIIGRRAIPGVGALAAGSYSLYLSHKMIFRILQNAFPNLPPALRPWELPMALAAALAIGALLYWAVERPFLKLRDRLSGASRSSLASNESLTPVAAGEPT